MKKDFNMQEFRGSELFDRIVNLTLGLDHYLRSTPERDDADYYDGLRFYTLQIEAYEVALTYITGLFVSLALEDKYVGFYAVCEGEELWLFKHEYTEDGYKRLI